ncbi:MAG: reverse transcriptase-like protein [Myxococcales bacterium]|nr:reverse transcriptase-like protein [Myxococcales bacterium]
MAWVSVQFKGKDIWAEVDDAGAPVLAGALRRVRYSPAAGAKIYTANNANIVSTGARPLNLPEGAAAEPVAGGAAGAGQGRAGSGFGKAGTRTAAQAAAAKVDATARLASLGPEVIRAFTDGACSGNPGPAGAGCVVRLTDGRVVERHKALGEGTNNIAELVAIGMVLEVLRDEGVARTAAVAIFSDSSYSKGVLTGGWKAKANVVLIRKLKEAMAEWPNAELNWVAGHVGIAENERADALANKGVYESR